ncbi:metallopeptidase [Candidatus Microgenomates bacterium]|nr:MAG: metallopeptidase [Candidatus Microgenomates bacterium]
MDWEDANEIKKDLEKIVYILGMEYVDVSRIFCYRTRGSKSRAYARIWAMPKIFQRALDLKPAYVIEVLSQYFDKLNSDEQKKVLIHELLHIPKNFSGALVPHKTRTRRISILTNQLYKDYKKIAK